METIEKYFGSELTPVQIEQFSLLKGIYVEWNSRINVVSRKDIDQLYTRHVLHSLAIARVCRFESGARILDVGCGGGFPSVPLAILFPEAHFWAVDSIGKKVRVTAEVARAASLDNLTALNCRAEQVDQRFDYVVSRAVADIGSIAQWTWPKIERGQAGTLPNGMILLKGGDLKSEIEESGHSCRVWNIADFFDEPFFETKKVVYLKR